MKTYRVTHQQGVAGVDESAIGEEYECEAESGRAAIEYCVSSRERDGWEWSREEAGITTCRNPEAANSSGRYGDYWMAEQVEVLTEAD
jgi:hypothetical protein